MAMRCSFSEWHLSTSMQSIDYARQTSKRLVSMSQSPIATATASSPVNNICCTVREMLSLLIDTATECRILHVGLGVCVTVCVVISSLPVDASRVCACVYRVRLWSCDKWRVDLTDDRTWYVKVSLKGFLQWAATWMPAGRIDRWQALVFHLDSSAFCLFVFDDYELLRLRWH